MNAAGALMVAAALLACGQGSANSGSQSRLQVRFVAQPVAGDSARVSIREWSPIDFRDTIGIVVTGVNAGDSVDLTLQFEIAPAEPPSAATAASPRWVRDGRTQRIVVAESDAPIALVAISSRIAPLDTVLSRGWDVRRLRARVSSRGRTAASDLRLLLD